MSQLLPCHFDCGEMVPRRTVRAGGQTQALPLCGHCREHFAELEQLAREPLEAGHDWSLAWAADQERAGGESSRLPDMDGERHGVELVHLGGWE